MSKKLAPILIAAVVCGIGLTMQAENFSKAQNREQAKAHVRHVVLFKFKEEVTPQQIQKVIDAFGALQKKIDVIRDFEWGTDVSVEHKTHGFTHCFLVTFDDEKGRDIYLPHPDHKEFGKLVGPLLEDVLVFDFVWRK